MFLKPIFSFLLSWLSDLLASVVHVDVSTGIHAVADGN